MSWGDDINPWDKKTRQQKLVINDKERNTNEHGTTVTKDETRHGLTCKVRVRGEGPARTIPNVDEIVLNQQQGTAQLHTLNGYTVLIKDVTSVKGEHTDKWDDVK